jgi:hypothetical protein
VLSIYYYFNSTRYEIIHNIMLSVSYVNKCKKCVFWKIIQFSVLSGWWLVAYKFLFFVAMQILSRKISVLALLHAGQIAMRGFWLLGAEQ